MKKSFMSRAYGALIGDIIILIFRVVNEEKVLMKELEGIGIGGVNFDKGLKN
ncbi:MAG TPA: hypothetical protein VK186_20990 [Candidatus Deferrimicrobium sp.]|nr:hypothetical protein [Candidatus Deferrimicrobium sp.]